MTNNIQQWLEDNYPSQGVSRSRWLLDRDHPSDGERPNNPNFLKKRSEITELNISRSSETERLLSTESPLKLEGFDNLRELNCDSNKITSLKIKNCPNLEKITCSHNQLAELNLQDFPKLKTLICNDNKLTNLNISNNKELEDLNIMGNSLAENLSLLNPLIKLKELRLGNNLFNDSLEPLKNIGSLKLLDIRNTDISSGLEHLPDSVNLFNCLADVRKDAQVKKIYDLFANEQGKVELLTGQNKGFIKDFSAKLRAYKQKITEKVTEGTKDKEIQKLKGEIDDLKDQLKTANKTIKDLKEKLPSTDQAKKIEELEESLSRNRELTNKLRENNEEVIKNLRAKIVESQSFRKG